MASQIAKVLFTHEPRDQYSATPIRSYLLYTVHCKTINNFNTNFDRPPNILLVNLLDHTELCRSGQALRTGFGPNFEKGFGPNSGPKCGAH